MLLGRNVVDQLGQTLLCMGCAESKLRSLLETMPEEASDNELDWVVQATDFETLDLPVQTAGRPGSGVVDVMSVRSNRKDVVGKTDSNHTRQLRDAVQEATSTKNVFPSVCFVVLLSDWSQRSASILCQWRQHAVFYSQNM